MEERSRRFDGKVALVTGAGAGVGAATAARLAREGAAVGVVDVRADAAEEVAATIGAQGGEAAALPADVSDEAAVAGVVAAAVARWGRLDILHNNAAALGDAPLDQDLTELDLAVWERAMAVNAAGTMLGCKHAVPAMRAAGGGSIVNTAAVSGSQADDTLAAYGSSKAAVLMLTRYVATMYGRDRIRCNAVSPSLILTETSKAALSQRHLDELAAERLLPWPADPEDVAGVVAWLCSDEARCLTGQDILVDSGTCAHRPWHALRAWDDHLTAAGLLHRP